MAYYEATVNRLDNTHYDSRCRTLTAGSESPWYNDSLHMNSVMDKTVTSWVDMEKVGAAVTMEHRVQCYHPCLMVARVKSGWVYLITRVYSAVHFCFTL